jgi:hypothetical protein
LFLIEATDRGEHRSPNDPATGPESRRVLTPLLMGVRVKQVLELCDKVLRGRGVVVAPEQRVDARLRLEHCGSPIEGLGMRFAVSVDKKQVLSRRLFSTQIPRRSWTTRAINGDHLRPPQPRQLCRTVGRPIIDDDQLEVRPTGSIECIQAALEIRAPVVNWYDHGEVWWIHFNPRETTEPNFRVQARVDDDA